MMKSLLTTLLLITGISMAQPPNQPSVPQTMSFQAMITDTLGVPIADGSHNFTFRIERPNQGGQVQTIWEETKQVDVVDGIVSTILGSVTPIGFIPINGIFSLSVSLNNEIISISPLTSVPFSFNASRAINAINAARADTAHFTHQAAHAMHADTARFVMFAPVTDTSHFAHQAQYAEHADTANYVTLGNYYGSISVLYSAYISVVKDDDAELTLFSTHDNSSSYLSLVSQNSAGDQRELRVINEGDIGGAFRFYDATNGENLMVIDTSGKMGLGVSYPSEKLEINDGNVAIDNGHYYMSKNSSGALVAVLWMDSNDDLKLGHYSGANDLYLRANGDRVMVDGQTGNVGIDNTNPQEKLDVDGNVKVDTVKADVLVGDGSQLTGLAAGGATSVNGLSDALVETNSMYIGNDPSSTTDNSQYNVAIGPTALDAITTGDGNTVTGHSALGSNTEGYNNTAMGYQALRDNTTGINNTALGRATLATSTGSRNTAIGSYALAANTTAESNTATGYMALRFNLSLIHI